MNIIVITDREQLERLSSIAYTIANLIHPDDKIYSVSLAIDPIDSAFKVKFNEEVWSPPMKGEIPNDFR